MSTEAASCPADVGREPDERGQVVAVRAARTKRCTATMRASSSFGSGQRWPDSGGCGVVR
jgi:hypothetical protein